MTEQVRNVLFLCTGNSARSILAEALLNNLGGGKYTAYSAGSFPKGAVHPVALETLRSFGLSTEGLRSKSWNEFAAPGAPKMDFILTVCDQAAGEVCPVWPGHPATAHWGMPDPAAVGGPHDMQVRAFHETARILERRIQYFLAIPFSKLRREQLHESLLEAGRQG
ncbi:MAG: arsenate reductase ArsC [Rhodospirillaceae bacterium]